MTITRSNPGGWALNQTLTSAQQNALDINVTNALDKRTGQSDTSLCVTTISNPGSLTIDTLTLTGANKVLLASRTQNRVMEFQGPWAAGAVWVRSAIGNPFGGLWQTNANTSDTLYVPVHVPNGVLITSVAIWVQGAASGAATKGTANLWKQPYNGSIAVSQGSQLDTAAGAAYTNPHAVTINGLGVTVDKTANMYLASMSSESGAGASFPSYFFSVVVNFVQTNMDDCAG